MRIVSLDYCADQYVLKLADREQILAISPDGVKDFSYMRDAAKAIPTVRPLAENVLILKPDLVVRSYGGGPKAEAFFEQAGIPVLNVGWAMNIDGEDDSSIPAMIQRMADGLGQPERGETLVTEFRARLTAVQADDSHHGKTLLYLPPSGVTTGPGSKVHDMIVATGYDNFQQSPGWRPIDLERLSYEQPDLIATAYFGAMAYTTDTWSVMRHPVAKKQLTSQKIIPLEGMWTTCDAWFLADAIEALAEGEAE